MNSNFRNWRFLLIVLTSIFAIVAYDFVIAKYSFPLTEGWWELLARESLNKKLYIDVYFPMPPLYINLLGGLLAFTNNFYELRLFFIFVHVIEFLFLSYFLSKFYEAKFAILGALISELLITTYHVAYIPKDYHMLLGLLVSIYLICFYYLDRLKNYYIAFVIGVVTSLILLTKQNVGGIFILAAITIIALEKLNWRRKLALSLVYLLSIFLALYLYSAVAGFEWVDVYLANDSKGSLFTFVTRFIRENSVQYAAAWLAIFYFYYYLKHNISEKYQYFFGKFEEIISNKYLIAVLIAYLSIKLARNIDFDILLSIIIFCLVVNLINAVGLSKINQKFTNFGLVSLLPLTIVYGNSMTAGFNFVGVQIGVAMFFASSFTEMSKIRKSASYIFIALIFSISAINFYRIKINGDLYSWWGYAIGGLIENSVDDNNPKLQGLKVSYETEEILKNVRVSLEQSKNEGRYYFYPHIPLFYFLYDIPLTTKFPILWFDTAPSKFRERILAEFNSLQPEYIYWLKPPRFVYDGHAGLRGQDSVMTDVDEIILKGIESGAYEIVYTRPMGLEGRYLRDKNFPISVTMLCSRCTESLITESMTLGKIIAVKNSGLNTAGRGIVNFTFSNPYQYIKFAEEHTPLILDSEKPVFMILKKNK